MEFIILFDDKITSSKKFYLYSFLFFLNSVENDRNIKFIICFEDPLKVV